MHTRSIRPHSPYEIACWACVIGWLKFVHFVTGGPCGLHCFGRFAGLPSEDLHGVIYLIVLGFAAAGIAAMLFFCEESNAGKAFRAIRKAGSPAPGSSRRSARHNQRSRHRSIRRAFGLRAPLSVGPFGNADSLVEGDGPNPRSR